MTHHRRQTAAVTMAASNPETETESETEPDHRNQQREDVFPSVTSRQDEEDAMDVDDGQRAPTPDLVDDAGLDVPMVRRWLVDFWPTTEPLIRVMSTWKCSRERLRRR
jgi:hypothetical protein